jgi:hypothetical protein
VRPQVSPLPLNEPPPRVDRPSQHRHTRYDGVVKALPAILAAALILAGCGSHTSGTACTSPKARKALTRLESDLIAIKRAAALPAPDTLKGNAAINRATDRFLLHVETAPIDNLKRNRLIDHAAAFLVGNCEQCFQALEAARPIVSIAHGDRGCPAALGRRQTNR